MSHQSIAAPPGITPVSPAGPVGAATPTTLARVYQFMAGLVERKAA